jgi:Na+-transporting methylmalonyl-CoA/oxaloacetate decarboxylase gamma subunit
VDAAILSGPNLAFVGISTVFVALMLMYGAITLMRRLVAPETDAAAVDAATAAAVAAANRGTAATSGDSTAENEEETLRSVALAAYAYHASTSVRVPAGTGSSPWQRAGRAAQVATRRPRS